MRLKSRVLFLVLALVVAVGLLAPAYPARAYTSVSISFFHDHLARYGDWVTVSSYGRCWRPAHVAVGWQPYLYGEWSYTDAGWTWVSFDAWGGDPYHYGTWVYTASDGWVWIPGTIWAPAWVTWCISDDAFGWAPVPPSFIVGVSGYSGPAVTVSSRAYVFVPARQFAGVNVSSVRMPSAQNATFVARSRPSTQFAVHGGTLASGGPAVAQVERQTGRRIQRVSLGQARTQAVPIRTSLQGGRARGAVVVPANERAKLVGPHERHAPQLVSRTSPGGLTSGSALREPSHPSSHEREHAVHAPSSPSTPRHERSVQAAPSSPSTPRHERSVQAAPSSPSSPKHERSVQAAPSAPSSPKHERSVQAAPPPPSKGRHEVAGTQARLEPGRAQGNGGGHSQPAPGAHAERPPNVQPRPQGPPPAAHANPPEKGKEKEHGKEN